MDHPVTGLRFDPPYLRDVHPADRAASELVRNVNLSGQELRHAVRWAIAKWAERTLEEDEA